VRPLPDLPQTGLGEFFFSSAATKDLGSATLLGEAGIATAEWGMIFVTRRWAAGRPGIVEREHVKSRDGLPSAGRENWWIAFWITWANPFGPEEKKKITRRRKSKRGGTQRRLGDGEIHSARSDREEVVRAERIFRRSPLLKREAFAGLREASGLKASMEHGA